MAEKEPIEIRKVVDPSEFLEEFEAEEVEEAIDSPHLQRAQQDTKLTRGDRARLFGTLAERFRFRRTGRKASYREFQPIDGDRLRAISKRSLLHMGAGIVVGVTAFSATRPLKEREQQFMDGRIERRRQVLDSAINRVNQSAEQLHIPSYEAFLTGLKDTAYFEMQDSAKERGLSAARLGAYLAAAGGAAVFVGETAHIMAAIGTYYVDSTNFGVTAHRIVHEQVTNFKIPQALRIKR